MTPEPADEPAGDSAPRKKRRRNKRRRRPSRGGESRLAALALPNEKPTPGWYDLVIAAMHSPVLDQERTVYTNRTLRFDRVKAIGFDFDHTLAVYNCDALDNLAKQLVIDRLIQHESIPAKYFDHIPDSSFARKGLLVDTVEGCILKIDRHGHVTHAYRGDEKLAPAIKRDLYSELDVIPHVTQGSRFVQVDSAFAKPEVLIYTSVAPHLNPEDRKKLWKTVRHHTDTVHRDGSLKKVITANPLDFLHPDLETIAMLQHLRQSGKKVFLVTNSEWEYTRQMINPALGLGTDPDDMRWLELFDLTVVHAGKPGYFASRKKREPRIIGPDNLVEGGDTQDLESRIGCTGPEILYVGDHIYADLITSKRRQHWRTMMIISEVQEEMHTQAVLPGIVQQLSQADERRIISEREVQHWRSIEKALHKLKDPEHRALVQSLKEECAQNRKQSSRDLKEFIQQRERLRGKLATATNRYWGSLFRASNELTYYGRQLEDFACLYTSRATNLLYYPTNHYFRSSMDYLPHELEQI